MKVREKKAKEAWTDFCYENEVKKNSKAPKILNNDEIQKIIGHQKQKAESFVRTPAPFFAPARKFGKENC